MAIIVRNKNTNKKYILLGAGYGMYKSSRPSALGGNWCPHKEEGEVSSLAVCDNKGNIFWMANDELQVVEVDGKKLEEFEIAEGIEENLKEDENEKIMRCPACGAEVSDNQKICDGCGITLIIEDDQVISMLDKINEDVII